MSIEIRNISPSDLAVNVPTDAKVEFDIVAMNDYTIDISTLSISIETASKIIAGEINSIVYGASDEEVFVSGANPYYHVSLTPSFPYDEGQEVTVAINIQGMTNENLSYTMPEDEIKFATAYNGLVSDFRFAFINATEKIPVYNEILRKDSSTSPRIFDSAFERWNDDKNLKIRLNSLIIRPEDVNWPFKIDRNRGLVIFNSPLSYNDKVDASYTFRFFSSEEINTFFRMALSAYTIAPPWGGPSTIYSASRELQGALLVGASLYAYRELLFQLSIQEKRIIFDNASQGEGWSKAQEIFKSEYEMSKDAWEKVLEAKKSRLPATGILIASDYTLPGGRSRMFRYMFK